MITPNIGESPDENVFYCLFCEKVTTFKSENYERFEGHMKSVHMVVTNLDTAAKVNFLKKEKKDMIVDQAKAVAKKGETFFCGLCSDCSEFVLGKTNKFKAHMEVAHNIFFDIGTFLALNLTILNNRFESKNFAKDPGSVSIPQNADMEVSGVDQIYGNTSINNSEIQKNEVTPEGEDKDVKQIENIYHTDQTHEAIEASKLPRKNRNKEGIVKRYNYNSIGLSQDGIFEHKYNDYECQYCSFVPNKVPLEKTTKSHTNEAQIRVHMRRLHYVCTICGEKLSSEKELNIHYESDHKADGKQVKCSIGGCTSQLTYRSMLTHVQAAHKGDVFLCNLSVMNMSNNETKNCGKKYPRLSSLNAHKNQPHIIQAKKVKPKVECTFCGKLITASSLRPHIKLIHGDTYFCSSCSFSTKYTSYLKVHEQGHQETFKCPMCDFSCSLNYHLKTHIKAQHEIGEIYLCSFCEYKTAFSHRLKGHEKSHGEHNLKCPKCDYKGKTKDSLRSHMKQHQDPKFQCQQCEYKTYDAGNFSAHKIAKHGTVALKCEQCSYSTKVNRQLRRHTENSHGITLPKKRQCTRKITLLPDSINDGQP